MQISIVCVCFVLMLVVVVTQARIPDHGLHRASVKRHNVHRRAATDAGLSNDAIRPVGVNQQLVSNLASRGYRSQPQAYTGYAGAAASNPRVVDTRNNK
ncbi:hypothetical protein SNE40_000078 [Patella caerulea]|uniref:Secreted protein n=1 Tax=Patella caerulea TaxID=87958 RepID=A0AAN8QGK1_PATCE